MTSSTEYSDTLRAVGRFLDDIQAHDIEISDQGEGWNVTWEEAGTTPFTRSQLEDLRDSAGTAFPAVTLM